MKTDRGVVLLVDYPGRRPEAHLSDLRLDGDGIDCRVPLTPPLPRELSAPAYAQRLHERLGGGVDDVRAIVSYCATAPLAVAMAARLGRARRTDVPIVFLDPSRCHEYHIVNGYDAVTRQIEGRVALPDRPPRLDIAALLGTPDLLVTEIAADLTRRARISLVADGFDESDLDEPVDNVVGMYVQWLTYLVAVHHREQPPPTGELLQVISRDHPADAGWLGVAEHRTIRVDCTRPDLARHPTARAAVRAFLDRVATTTPVRMG